MPNEQDTRLKAGRHGKFFVRAMCRRLRIQLSGFYSWLKGPLSKRALDDRRQTEMLKEV